MKTWPLAVYSAVQSRKPEKYGRMTADQLVKATRQVRSVAAKDAARLIAFHELRDPEAGRKTENIVAVHAIPADIDEGFDRGVFEGALRELEQRGFLVIAHETYSSTPQNPRWRVIVFLDEPVTPEVYGACWNGLNVLFDGMLDGAAKDAARISYVPSCPPGQTRAVRVINEALWTQ